MDEVLKERQRQRNTEGQRKKERKNRKGESTPSYKECDSKGGWGEQGREKLLIAIIASEVGLLFKKSNPNL